MSETESLILYLVVYIVSAALISRWNNKGSLIFAILGFIPPILLAAQRYMVGTDFGVYMVFFKRDGVRTFSDIFENFYSEGGFHTISHIAYQCGSPELYLGACAALTLIPVIVTYHREYGERLIGVFALLVLLTLFTTSMNIMRQGIAISFTFVASYYIYTRNLKMFLLWIALAMTFHLSAAIFVPAYFFYSKDNKISKWQWLIVVCALICLIYSSSLLSSLSGMEGFEKYEIYNDTDDRAQNRSIFLTLFLLILFIVRRRQIFEIDNRANTYLLCFIISFIIELTGFATPFIKRSGLYFSIYGLPLACLWIRTFRNSYKTLAKTFIIIFYILRFTVITYVLGQANIIPYNTTETYKSAGI